jgi:hypothetical protein
VVTLVIAFLLASAVAPRRKPSDVPLRT